jgi:hypothetical protein
VIGRRPALAFVPALALVLAGCDAWPVDQPADEYDYVSVCEDRAGNRVEDDRCPADGLDHPQSSFVWFYMPTAGGVQAPPIGHRIDRSIGTYRPPSALPGGKVPSVARGGSVNPSGGSVQRGGFGVSGGGKPGASGGGKSGGG